MHAGAALIITHLVAAGAVLCVYKNRTRSLLLT
jgi:hypothetical protein